MKIIILGAGTIGVTTAYFLARQGHEVTVLEKNQESAFGCSYANGGQLSYSHIEPWASRSSLFPLLKAAIIPNSFLSIKDFTNKDFLQWGREFVKNCNTESVNENSKKILALSLRSKVLMKQLLASEEEINFNYQEKGSLHFFRNKKSFNKALIQLAMQKNLGCKSEVLDKDECIKLEPTLVRLDDKSKLSGGIFYPDDSSGDGYLFTKSLAEISQRKYGVKFVYNCQIKNILTNYQKITGINTDKEVFAADAYVYALGVSGAGLLEGVKLYPKIYPIKGYSLSIETDKDYLSPNLSLTDAENKIVYSKLGSTFRAAGTIEINGLNGNINQKHIGFLKETIKESFSDFGNIAVAKEWCGFRPFRPNSIPLICKVEKYQNFFINSGHGSLGWTLSLASAFILSNLVQGQKDANFNFLENESRSLYS